MPDVKYTYSRLLALHLLCAMLLAACGAPPAESEAADATNCTPCGDRLWYERDFFQLGKTTEDVVLNDAFSLCGSGAPVHDVLSLELPAGEDSDPNLGISLELTQGCDDGSASSRSQVRVIATGDRAGY